MDFGSDNVVGASGPIMEALAEAARHGPEGTYGTDRWSREAQDGLNAVFERPVTALFVTTGTAANALALAAMTPPWGGVFCHHYAHVNDEECGAPEFFTAGAKLIGLPGAAGKIAPDSLRETLKRFPRGVPRQVEAASVSLSQATECGTAYTPDEVRAVAAVAHEAGLAVHMDGARFANALVGLDCAPADISWRAGVDVLSFGATKNGALACEAIIFFDERLAAKAEILRKRGGHTLSKGRLLGAQMAAYLRDDHWLALARHANAAAARLAEGLAALSFRLPWRREANEVFVVLPHGVDAALRAAGAHYYPWDRALLDAGEQPSPEEVFVRLVCSFETRTDAVDRLLSIASQSRLGTVSEAP